MLVNQLLLSIRVDNNRKIVKCFNRPSHLKSIDEVYRYRYRILAQLIQKRILDINGLVHFSRTPIIIWIVLKYIQGLSGTFLL